MLSPLLVTILQDQQQQILQRGADHLRLAARCLRNASNPQLDESEVANFIDNALKEVAECLRVVSGELVVIKRGGEAGDLSWSSRVEVLSEAAGFIDTLAVHLDHAKYATLVRGYRISLGRCVLPDEEIGSVAGLIGRHFVAVEQPGVSHLDPVVLRQAN